ncbi:MAG: SUMF1/EgtB/PvdO family nonheme iron enzyme [Myxococcales bacterium]|nr:SUMF1/EgtB/PvdO family nonheme iron enzyme [Myxococcales bacterium]
MCVAVAVLVLVGCSSTTVRRSSPTSAVDAAQLEWIPVRSAGILVSRTEVSRAQYAQCVAAKACRAVGPIDRTKAGTDLFCYLYPALPVAEALEPKRPVTCVTWFDATAFASWVGGRLPTYDEFVTIVTDGGADHLRWGDEQVGCDRVVDRSRCADFIPQQVCSHPQGNSPDGVCDLIGNAGEWLAKDGAEIPSYLVGDDNISVGGDSATFRPTDRAWLRRHNRYFWVGFRVVRDLAPE